jgi:flagellar FliJ protein
MHPFRFRLEALLKFRKLKKEQAQIEFMQAASRLAAEKEKLQQLERKLADNIDAFRTCQNGPVNVENLKVFQYYFDKIKKDIIVQQDGINKAFEDQQQCMRVLEAAVKQCKVVESYREKRLLQYNAEVLCEEQKQLDEIGLQIYARTY